MAASFVRNTGWGLLGAGLSAPAVFLTSVLLARWLDPAANGQAQAGLSLLAVLAFAAQPGAVAALIHRVRSAQTPPAEALTVALITVTVTGTLTAWVLWLLREPLLRGPLVGLPAEGLAWLLLTVVPLLWLMVLGGAARAVDRFEDWSMAEVSQKVAILCVLGGAVLSVSATASHALASVWLGTVVAAVWVAARLVPRVGLVRSVQRSEVVASGRFGLKTYLHTMAGQVHERVDLFLLAVLDGDPVHVATYAVAVGVAGRLRILPLALSAALFPRVAQMDRAAGARLTAQVVRIGLAALVVGCVVLGCVAPWLVPVLFGPAYAASVWPLWVLLPATIAMSVYLLVGRYFQGADRQGVNVVAQGVGVACNLALNLWLIPAHGPWGAAMASAVSYGLQALVVVVALARRGEVSVSQLLVVQRDDVAAVRQWVQRWRR